MRCKLLARIIDTKSIRLDVQYNPEIQDQSVGLNIVSDVHLQIFTDGSNEKARCYDSSRCRKPLEFDERYFGFSRIFAVLRNITETRRTTVLIFDDLVDFHSQR